MCECEGGAGEKGVEKKGRRERNETMKLSIGIIGDIWLHSVAALEPRSRGGIKAAGQMHKKPSHRPLLPDTDPSCPTPPKLTPTVAIELAAHCRHRAHWDIQHCILFSK